MDSYTKDLIDAISKIGGVLGVFVAIFVAYFQVRKNREERQLQVVKDEGQKQTETTNRQSQIDKDRTQREKELTEATTNRKQREEELRWRKASLARDVLKELQEDTYASDAMLMLDWSNREYTISKDHVENILRQEVWEALRISPTNFNTKEKYIRDCFDHFFGIMQRIEHFISINLVEFEDVEYPFNYFAGKLKVSHDVVEAFLKKYEYQKALAFLNRLDNWKARV